MSYVIGVEFTRMEHEFMSAIKDGNRHKISNFHDPIVPFVDREAVITRVARINRKLNGTGYSIICEFYCRATHYRLVRLITSNE